MILSRGKIFQKLFLDLESKTLTDFSYGARAGATRLGSGTTALVDCGLLSVRQDRIGKTPHSRTLDEMQCPFSFKQTAFQRFLRFVQHHNAVF